MEEQRESERSQMMADLSLAVRKVIVDTVSLFDTLAHQAGVNSTDMQCLNILDFEGPVTPGRLAELTGLSTGAITAALDRLEKRHLIRRTRDLHDRRKVLIDFSGPRDPQGVFAAIDTDWLTLCEKYSDAELATVLAFIKDMHEANNKRLPFLKQMQQKQANEEEHLRHSEA